jgi:hypothetical protein
VPAPELSFHAAPTVSPDLVRTFHQRTIQNGYHRVRVRTDSKRPLPYEWQNGEKPEVLLVMVTRRGYHGRGFPAAATRPSRLKFPTPACQNCQRALGDEIPHDVRAAIRSIVSTAPKPPPCWSTLRTNAAHWRLPRPALGNGPSACRTLHSNSPVYAHGRMHTANSQHDASLTKKQFRDELKMRPIGNLS